MTILVASELQLAEKMVASVLFLSYQLGNAPPQHPGGLSAGTNSRRSVDTILAPVSRYIQHASTFRSKGCSASKCNGREELCERRYSNITVVGAHNSFAWSDISIIRELIRLKFNEDVHLSHADSISQSRSQRHTTAGPGCTSSSSSVSYVSAPTCRRGETAY